MFGNIAEAIKPIIVEKILFDGITSQFTGLIVTAQHKITFAKGDIVGNIFFMALLLISRSSNPAMDIDQASFGEINAQQVNGDMMLCDGLSADNATKVGQAAQENDQEPPSS